MRQGKLVLVVALLLANMPLLAIDEVGQDRSTSEIVEKETENTKAAPTVVQPVPGPFPSDRRNVVVNPKAQEAQKKKAKSRAHEIRRIERALQSDSLPESERKALETRLTELKAEQMINTTPPPSH